MKEHNYAFQNADIRPRLQSRTQNICFVISIFAVILKRMVNRPLTYFVSQHNCSTPVFHPTAVKHSQTYCLQAGTLLFFFFFVKGMGSIMTK